MSRAPGRHAAAITVLAFLTLLKIGTWTGLEICGVTRPFVGDNATALYIPIARRLLVEHRFNGPDSRSDSKVPPAYPLLIAAAIAVAPHSFVKLVPPVQMLMDLGTALVLYWSAYRIGLPRIGILAACVWLLYPPAIVISTWITAETAFTALFTVGVAILALSFESGSTWFALVAGLAMGAATMFRGTPLLLPVALLPAAFRAGALRRWAAFSAMMAIVVVPWTIRNLMVLDDFIPVAVGAGPVILQGSDERFFTGDGKAAFYPAILQAAAEAGIARPTIDRESVRDQRLGSVGLWVQRKRFALRPLSIVPFFAHKLARVWYGTESGNFRQQMALGLCSLLILPAGLWQLWKWRVSHDGMCYVLLTALGYIVLMHVATLPEARYTFPIMPVLILGACKAYDGLYRRRVDRRNFNPLSESRLERSDTLSGTRMSALDPVRQVRDSIDNAIDSL